jgi:FlgD Ig-like domain
VARLLPTILVLALLSGTAAAFALTEGLKLEKSPIFGTRISPLNKVFSPRCECDTNVSGVSIRLRHADRVTASIVDSKGSTVRMLVQGARYRAGRHEFVWNGLTEGGTVAPDGVYRLRVHLGGAHKTIVVPNEIGLDTTPPQATLVSARPRTFAPGSGHVKIRYRVSEQARGIVYVDGQRAVGPSRFYPLAGKLDWYGKVGGGDAARGPHRISVGAVDLAGNVGKATPPVRVVVRYVELASHLLRARPGGLVLARYSPTGAVRWRLANKSGFGRNGVVRLRAPRQPGRYGLFVLQDGHVDRATVLVAP